ncbi:DUF3100 domain-containing protein [Acinetobacter sp. MB5]|uniref:DUF3100 domain-containing protein n=1 Tax=Acinetobacter sp. MB5 TaxID=2069438 RepID=UPI000DD07603|nr:DUF3100 domain-containing protein [Acinetobacter sp. MB5]
MGAIDSTATHRNGFFIILGWAFIILIISEKIGPITIPLGQGKITLLPMIWALILGAILGVISSKRIFSTAMTKPLQIKAAHYLQPALLFFIAKLGLVVGSSLPVVFQAGWALIFQEFGHFVGTVVIAMPIALLLGIKREAIGATFSVGREPSLAIISEKYGMNSPEGRGVLAEYITGTLIGAIFISIVAGFVTSLNIFDPRSLAMASGVGSGSMMAGAAGAISAHLDAQTADTVMALAAASNLLTTTFGTYFTLFISLPLAVASYRVLEPILGRWSRSNQPEDHSTNELALNAVEETEHSGSLQWLEKAVILVMVSIMSMLANWIAFQNFSISVVVGCAIMIIIALLGDLIYFITKKKIPAVCFVSLIAMFASSPWCPWGAIISDLTKSMNVLAILTPMLTFAGLSIAKDIPAFRKLGWKIVLVSLLANFGTFIGAAMIAEIFH